MSLTYCCSAMAANTLKTNFLSLLPNPPMPTFPTDVITDILCRLPVKTLLRFKCTSKLWSSLIDDSEIAKLHIHHSMETNSNFKLFLDNCTESDDKAYSADFDSLCNLVQLPRPFPLEANKFRFNKYRSRVFGSCDGLLAVYHREAGIALWNPSTRKCHYLPTLGDDLTKDHDITPSCGYDQNTILGFGYDVANNDYKVVKMLRSKTQKCFQVMVYSLKANSWRRIKDCPYDIFNNYNDGAYVNGSLHWTGDKIGDSRVGKLIFALNLGYEEFYEVSECDIDIRDFDYKNVGVLGGCLCVFRDGSAASIEDFMVLWVMKDYGVKESWEKVINLSRNEWMINIYQTRVVGYSKSGDKILLEDGGFRPVWFNLEHKTVETIYVPGASESFSTMIYVESLVSVS